MIGILGVSQIVHHPEILRAVSPLYALVFIWDNPVTAFIILGAVVLCVTGAEALYADLGHFGKGPIRIAWFSIVLPALFLNYFGQGALLLRSCAADPTSAVCQRALGGKKLRYDARMWLLLVTHEPPRSTIWLHMNLPLYSPRAPGGATYPG